VAFLRDVWCKKNLLLINAREALSLSFSLIAPPFMAVVENRKLLSGFSQITVWAKAQVFFVPRINARAILMQS
jgi:hypothetical protein